MACQDWTVRVYRTNGQEELRKVIVAAPNWLAAEIIANQDAAEDFGGDENDFESEAEEYL